MPTLPWSAIDTVLLDMDGTLLDLHFDNHFWLEHLPQRYAERNGLSRTEADAVLEPLFREHAGQLNWYCLDFWSRELDLSIRELKHEVAHLISLRPHADTFLAALRRAGKRVALITNAHRDSLSLKLERIELAPYFDRLISSTTTATRRRTRASGAPCKPISASTRSAACSSTTACRSCAAPAPMVSPTCWRYATRTAVARSGTPRSSPPRRTTGGCSKDCRSRGNENPATRAGLAKRRDHSGMRRTWPG